MRAPQAQRATAAGKKLRLLLAAVLLLAPLAAGAYALQPSLSPKASEACAAVMAETSNPATTVIGVEISTRSGGREIDTKDGTLEFFAEVLDGNGLTRPYEEQLDGPLEWLIAGDDPLAAKINEHGVLTALKDGSVSVTAHLERGSLTSWPISISITRQKDVYVESAEIMDEAGELLGDKSADIILGEAYQFHVRVKLTNGTSLESFRGDEIPGVAWSIDNPRSGVTINKDTGRFESAYAGSNFQITVSVPVSFEDVGGNAPRKDSKRGYINVLSNNDGSNGSTATSLKINVEYEEAQGKVAPKPYSLSQLKELEIGRIYHYTMNTSSGTSQGAYSTHSVQGVELARILQDMGLDERKVKKLCVYMHNEGNKEFPHEFLFQERYYFPNRALGRESEKEPVPPLLSLRGWRSSQDRQDEITKDPSCLKEEDFLLRLYVGAKGVSDYNASSCLKNVSAITVIMEGAPPDADDDPPPADSPGDGNDTGTVSGSNGNGPGSGRPGRGGSGKGGIGRGNTKTPSPSGIHDATTSNDSTFDPMSPDKNGEGSSMDGGKSEGLGSVRNPESPFTQLVTPLAGVLSLVAASWFFLKSTGKGLRHRRPATA